MKTVALLALTIPVAWSQTGQPSITNAEFETRAFSGNLATQLRADRPTWFAYAVKSASPNRQSCCWNGGAQCGCSLEDNGDSRHIRANPGSPVHLEGSDSLAIVIRVSNNTVDKIQAYSLSCPLDAGGLPFVWLTGVPQDASLSFLQNVVGQGESGHRFEGALFAISQHEGTHAIDILIEMARQNPSAHLRGQALFWLAQRAGERAAATITNAIENDPNGEVKKKAVFALSQLPKDEAIPKLIEVARTQRNPEVRKQAFFWLGQSQDPRAFAYIQEVLTK